MKYYDSYGWPVEMYKARKYTNLFRIILHANIYYTLKYWLFPEKYLLDRTDLNTSVGQKGHD
jgi:hypothetical protein